MNAALGPKSGASTRAIARIDLLSTQEVRTVHYEAMTPVWNVAPHPHATPAETPGNWRKHDIAPFPEGMTPPPFPEIDHRMADWVKDVNNLREPSDVAFPERLARVHNDFERIHPFLDGNGRTAVSYTHLRAHETRHDLVCRL